MIKYEKGLSLPEAGIEAWERDDMPELTERERNLGNALGRDIDIDDDQDSSSAPALTFEDDDE